MLKTDVGLADLYVLEDRRLLQANLMCQFHADHYIFSSFLP